MTDRLLRLPQVLERTGLNRMGVYRGIRAGTFPRPRRLSARRVAWLDSDVTEWIRTRPEAKGDGEAA